jgi:glyoxylase I family protein
VRPGGLHHVSICVRDVDEAREFYTGVLGMTVADRPEELGDGLWLSCGGGQVHLLASDEPRSQRDHFALRVDDVDAAVAEIQALGVEVMRIPHIADGVGHQAFLNDPSGNLVELNQPDGPA